MMMFRPFAALLLLAGTAAGAAPAAPHAVVVDLMNKALADYPGKEAVMISVTYPPGAVDPIHRHDAHAFLYVLEGSIMMGVRGGKTVTLKPGQTFYEGPHDVHTIGRNASATKPAKFLVVLLKKRGDPILTLTK
jgi:quercetin dioxygenase-like cupin family protein